MIDMGWATDWAILLQKAYYFEGSCNEFLILLFRLVCLPFICPILLKALIFHLYGFHFEKMQNSSYS